MKWLSLAAIFFALQAAPAIDVDPGSGPTGSEFSVSGKSFEPGAKLKIFWGDQKLDGIAKVGRKGKFKYSAAVPDDAVAGSHTIKVKNIGARKTIAKTKFIVIADETSTNSTIPPDPPSATAEGQAGANASTSPADSESLTVGISGGALASKANGTEAASSRPIRDGSDSSPKGEGSNGFAALLVVLLLLCGVAAGYFMFWGARERNNTKDPDDNGQTSDTRADLPPLAPSKIEKNGGDWARHMLQLAPYGQITNVASTPDGLIGVGNALDEEGFEHAAAWSSSDGVRWETASMLGPAGATLVVPWGDGALMTSSEQSNGKAKTSYWYGSPANDWEQGINGGNVLDSVTFAGLVAGGGVLVAWGSDADGPAVWLSQDGAAWERSTLRGEFDLITTSEVGFLAVGRNLDDRRPIVAHSTDGHSWEEIPEDLTSVFEGASTAAFASYEGGMVLAGTDLMRGTAAVWVSDDGKVWHRVPLEPEPGTSIEHLGIVADRLVAVGADSARRAAGKGTVVIWQSQDAVSWERVPTDDLFADSASSTLVNTANSVLLFGSLQVEREGGELETVAVNWQWTPVHAPSSDSGKEPDEDSGEEEALQLASVAADSG